MVSHIRPFWIMIYPNCFIIIFHHCYNFDLIKIFVPIINVMLYISKIGYYLEILTDEEVKDFVAINCGKSIKKQNPRKVTKSLSIFFIFETTPDLKVQSNSSGNFV